MSDIVHRTVEKDEKLATLRDHRDHVNACKSLERKLDLDLKREKVHPSRVIVIMSVIIIALLHSEPLEAVTTVDPH